MIKKIIGIFIVGLFIGVGVIPAISGNHTNEMTGISNENKLANCNNARYDTGVEVTMSIQPPEPPVAKFSWIPEDPEIGEEITFDASASFAINQCKIVSYEWDLDEDGIYDDASGKIIKYCYYIRDIYDITLKVTDNADMTGKTTKSIDFRNPPETPTITGESSIKMGEPYTCHITTTDPDQDNVFYKINWGTQTTDWLGPYVSGETITKEFTYSNKGDFTIKVKAKDKTEAESNWGTMTVNVPQLVYNKKILRFDFIDLILEYLYRFSIFTQK